MASCCARCLPWVGEARIDSESASSPQIGSPAQVHVCSAEHTSGHGCMLQRASPCLSRYGSGASAPTLCHLDQRELGLSAVALGRWASWDVPSVP